MSSEESVHGSLMKVTPTSGKGTLDIAFGKLGGGGTDE
jgi:hypothetical protein